MPDVSILEATKALTYVYSDSFLNGPQNKTFSYQSILRFRDLPKTSHLQLTFCVNQVL